jgi:hypothetical protein
MSAPAGRGPLHDLFSRTMHTQLDLASSLLPVFSAEVEGDELTRKLTVAARLLNADLGIRVLDVGRGGFDTHDSEARAHGPLLRDLDEGVRAFFATLAPWLRDQVTLMTVSEFGRTIAMNGSGGTDHGTAAPLLVVGAAVRGGAHATAPSLTRLSAEGQMVATVDFRAVYGSVLDGWMGGGGSDVIGGSFEHLDLFRSAPGAALTGRPTPIVVVPPASAGGFEPMTPIRIFDTRDGTGGRSAPLGSRESWVFPVRGSFGVPVDAVAVAVNVTSVDATTPTYVTVWPSGLGRPLASNLNPVPQRATPNLVVVRLGSDGAVQLYNNSGSVHLVGDLVGWFSPASPNGLVPVVPTRLLDTRPDGIGHRGALTSGGTVEIDARAAPDVPAGAVALALNVTATEPTEASFLSVWPAGRARPLVSTVNMVGGDTTSTCTFMGIGDDGLIDVRNNTGSSHVVVDVLGAFVPGARGKFVSLSPSRVLDTRDGTGMGSLGATRIGQEPLVVEMLGRGGLPAGSVGAVMMNVTAVRPTRDTYLSVFPHGHARPLASNVNASAGEIRPNLVVAALGSDGAVTFSNNSGTTDIVADVMGYFVAD